MLVSAQAFPVCACTARVYVESFWSFSRWHKCWFPVLKHGDFPVRQQSPTVKFPKGNIPIVSPFYGISHEKNTTHSILTIFPLPSHFLYPLLSGYELHHVTPHFSTILIKIVFQSAGDFTLFLKNKGTIFLSRLAGQVPSWWPWNSWTALVGAAPPMRWNPWTTPWPWELRRLGFTVGTILTEKVGEIEMFNEFFCFFKWIIYGYMAYKMNPDIFLTCLSNNVILHFVRALNKNTFTLHTFTI